MKGDIYIFGSTVRGEVEKDSDIDVLVIPSSETERESFPNSWSVYSQNTIRNYFEQGRLFAWHLYLEAKCVYSSEENSFMANLGTPKSYITFDEDIANLEILLEEALVELQKNSPNLIYELGIIYTALRDIAMVASSRLLKKPNFSRNSPYKLPITFPIPMDIYQGMMQARLISTRDMTCTVDFEKLRNIVISLPIKKWVDSVKDSL